MSAPGPARATWRPWSWPLHAQIGLGLVVGAGLGLALGMATVASIPGDVVADQRGVVGSKLVRSRLAFQLLQLLGDLFLQALYVIIIPLITSTIVLAVARIGGSSGFGRLGLKAIGFYLATSLSAVLTGLVLINLVSPGITDGVGILEGRDLSAFADAQAEVTRRVAGHGLSDFLNVFRTMIPDNIIGAAAGNNFLGLIMLSIVTGYFTTKLATERRAAFETFIEAIGDLAMLATQFVLALAPFGVMALIARTFAEQYATLWPDARFASFLAGIATFAGVALAGLLIHFLVTLPLILMVVARRNPLRHYKAMAPALLMSFSTASSAATLPVTLDCVHRRAGVSKRVAGFTLPLGATVNMDGTALYECVSAMFICQAFGLELGFTQQATIVIVALLTSVGVAGVPSASLVAIAIILETVQGQLPTEAPPSLLLGMGLLFVFDRPLDMARTAVNVFGDSVAAVTIARTEGETEILTAETTQRA